MAGTFFDGEVITIVNTDAADVITIAHNNGVNGFWNKSGAANVLSIRDIARYKFIITLALWVEL